MASSSKVIIASERRLSDSTARKSRIKSTLSPRDEDRSSSRRQSFAKAYNDRTSSKKVVITSPDSKERRKSKNLSDDPVRNIGSGDPVRNVSDDRSKSLSDDSLRNVGSDDEDSTVEETSIFEDSSKASEDTLRNVGSDDRSKSLSDDSLRNVGSDDTLRNVGSDDTLRNVGSDDTLRNVGSDDTLRNVGSDDEDSTIEETSMFTANSPRKKKKSKSNQEEQILNIKENGRSSQIGKEPVVPLLEKNKIDWNLSNDTNTEVRDILSDIPEEIKGVFKDLSSRSDDNLTEQLSNISSNDNLATTNNESSDEHQGAIVASDEVSTKKRKTKKSGELGEVKKKKRHTVNVGLRTKNIKIKVPDYDSWSEEDQYRIRLNFELRLDQLRAKWKSKDTTIPKIGDFKNLREAHIAIAEYMIHIQTINNANRIKIIYAILCYLVEIGLLKLGFKFVRHLGSYDYNNSSNDPIMVRWGEELIGSSGESKLSPLTQLIIGFLCNIACVSIINFLSAHIGEMSAKIIVDTLRKSIDGLTGVTPNLTRPGPGSVELLESNPIGTVGSIGLDATASMFA